MDLNHAVAIGMTDGPEAALPLVDTIAETGQLNEYYLLHATRADLLRRADRMSDASESYRARFFWGLRLYLVCTPTGMGQLDLEEHGARTIEGVAVRVAQRVLAMAAAIWHDNKTGAPVTRSLVAYDH